MANLSKSLIHSQRVNVPEDTPEHEKQLKVYRLMHAVSQQLWMYHGYAGEDRPWHDHPSKDFWWWQQGQRKSLRVLYLRLAKDDIPPWSYFVLLFAFSRYEMFTRPALLACRRDMVGAFRKLRTYVGSAAGMTRLAEILLVFLQLQVEQSGATNLTEIKVLEFDRGGVPLGKAPRVLLAYHRLWDRIRAVEDTGLDFEVWLREKYRLVAKRMEEKKADPRWQTWGVVSLKNIIKASDLDPKMTDLMIRADDPWVEIRDFLGLQYSCQFPDGYIPKGWFTAEFDTGEISEITSITGEGFYYRKDGTQRKGIRHYAHNKYLLIKCTPDNFKFFVDEWKRATLVGAMPTWQEYSAWAAHPGLWDATGTGLPTEAGQFIRKIHWRGSKNRKLELMNSGEAAT
jgi:hypothetical protein